MDLLDYRNRRNASLIQLAFESTLNSSIVSYRISSESWLPCAVNCNQYSTPVLHPLLRPYHWDMSPDFTGCARQAGDVDLLRRITNEFLWQQLIDRWRPPIFCSVSVFTARCTLVQSAVLRSHVVCLSVCPSVCDVGELWSHSWNSSEIISPSVTLGRSLFATLNMTGLLQGEHPLNFGPKWPTPLLIWASETFDRK